MLYRRASVFLEVLDIGVFGVLLSVVGAMYQQIETVGGNVALHDGMKLLVVEQQNLLDRLTIHIEKPARFCAFQRTLRLLVRRSRVRVHNGLLGLLRPYRQIGFHTEKADKLAWIWSLPLRAGVSRPNLRDLRETPGFD